MESGHMPSVVVAKCSELRDNLRRQAVTAALKEQAHSHRKRFDEEEQASFNALNGLLSKENLFDNLLALHRFSSDEKYSFRMFSHAQLIVDAMAEHLNSSKAVQLLLDILVNLSFYEEFEMPEDTEMSSLFLELVKLHPRETIILLSNISANRTRYSYSELFSKLIDNGFCQLVKQATINQETLGLSIQLLCGIAQTRPLLSLQCLEYVFQTICSYEFSSLSEESRSEVANMLGSWGRLKELNELAALLLQYFFELSLKLYDDCTFEILQFYGYISRHSEHLGRIAHYTQLKLQTTSLSGRFCEEAMLILIKITHIRHISLAELFGEEYIEKLLQRFWSEQNSYRAIVMEILELVAADKHAYHFYQHREFVEVMNHQLCSFVHTDIIQALQLLRTITDHAESDEVANRIISPLASKLVGLSNSSHTSDSHILEMCSQLLQYAESEMRP